MRPFLRRRLRWLLLGAVGLATLGCAAPFLVLDLSRPHAFDQVHAGMTPAEVDRIRMRACPMEEVTMVLQGDSYVGCRVTVYWLGNEYVGTDYLSVFWGKNGNVLATRRSSLGPIWMTAARHSLALVREALGL
jgi:hypothetical protein